jgi:hypothetical protein
MHVRGVVKDAVGETPVPDVKVGLYVGSSELAMVRSDAQGRFDYKESASYVGETLVCRMQREGYQDQQVTYEIDQEELWIEVELVPEPTSILVKVTVTGETGGPLRGATVTLQAGEETVGTGLTDQNGSVESVLSPDLRGMEVGYRVELGGYETARGEVTLTRETLCKITLRRPPKRFLWRPVILGFVGGIVGGILSGLVKHPVGFGICGAALGASLAIGLRDGKKMLRFIIAGVVGLYILAIVFFGFRAPLFLIPVFFAVVGLLFALALGRRSVIPRLVIAGFLGGVVGAFALALPALAFGLFGLSLGIALGIQKDEKAG